MIPVEYAGHGICLSDLAVFLFFKSVFSGGLKLPKRGTPEKMKLCTSIVARVTIPSNRQDQKQIVKPTSIRKCKHQPIVRTIYHNEFNQLTTIKFKGQDRNQMTEQFLLK